MESQSSDTVICRIYTARSIQLRHDTDIQRYTSSRSHDVTTASFWKNRVRAGFADGTMAAGWSEPDTKIKHHRSSNRQLQIQEAGSRRILHKTQLQATALPVVVAKGKARWAWRWQSLRDVVPMHLIAIVAIPSPLIPWPPDHLSPQTAFTGALWALGFFGWGEAFEPKVTNGSCCNVHSSFLTLTWCLWAAQKRPAAATSFLSEGCTGQTIQRIRPQKTGPESLWRSHTRIMLHDSHKFILMQTDFNTLRYFKILQDL